MNPQITTLIKGVEERSRAVDALIPNPTPYNISKILELQSQNDVDIKAIESLKSIEAAMASHKSYLGEPAPNQGVPLHNGAQFDGFESAGRTTVETHRRGRTIEQDGEGLLSLKQYKAISDPQYEAVYRKYLRVGERGLGATDLKTLQDGSDTAGGFTVPVRFVRRLVEKLHTPTRVQDFVTTIETGSDKVEMPASIYNSDDLYSTGVRTTWSGEIPASAASIASPEPVFGLIETQIYTAMLSLGLTNNMVEDSAFPVLSWVEGKFAETIELLKENIILNGTGIGQPAGILVNPGSTFGARNQPAVVTIGNPLTADGLVKAAFAIPEQYERNIKWVFNKTNTAFAIADLKDAQNRYLWGMGYEDSGIMVGGDGMPNVGRRALLGYPVLLQGFMPNTGANNYPIIIGDLAGYYLMNRVGFSIIVMRETYAETNQVKLVGRVRFGGQVHEDWRLKVCQNA